MPLQQRSQLCRNNIPHKCIGFQPSNLSTKDQRIPSRLSQKRTIVLWTLHKISAPIKLCIVGINLYLGLCEFLHYKSRCLKGIKISLDIIGKENSFQKKKTLICVLYLCSFFPSFQAARKEKQMDLFIKLWLISTAWTVFDQENIYKKLGLCLLEQLYMQENWPPFKL